MAPTTATVKCESEGSSPDNQSSFQLSSSSLSQQATYKRTKAMRDAGVLAVNAYLVTGDDYVIEREAFLSSVDELRTSAEWIAVALGEVSPADKNHRQQGPHNTDMHELAVQKTRVRRPEDGNASDQEDGTFEERIVDLEYAWKQERMKRKRLQEDFEAFQTNMANVLTENAQEMAELRDMLTARTPSSNSHAMSSVQHNKATRGPRNINSNSHTVKKLKTEGLDLTNFSWDQTLDKTQLTDPSDGFIYLLSDYPDLKTQVLSAIERAALAPILLSNRASSSRGLWQCVFSRARGEGGLFRGTYNPPSEACARCAAAESFCVVFKIGSDPANAETRLLPLEEGRREWKGFGDEGFFRVVRE